jgi:CheY-like chemotaxis protein
MDRKLILFVEDSEHDRELYGKLLWYNGFDVKFAMTGADGIRCLETERPRLVVLDLHLPDVSGTEVCAKLRANERTSDVPVLILTGRPKREFGAWADRMGCAGFLEKPVTPLEVLYEVERVIGRAPLPGEIVAEERRSQEAVGGMATGSPPVDEAAPARPRNPFEPMTRDDSGGDLPLAARAPESNGVGPEPASTRGGREPGRRGSEDARGEPTGRGRQPGRRGSEDTRGEPTSEPDPHSEPPSA